MLSQDINPISKRPSDVLTFFRKLREEENEAHSQNYISSESFPSQNVSEISSQSSTNTLFSSQNTYETSSQITQITTPSLSYETNEEDMISNYVEQNTGN